MRAMLLRHAGPAGSGPLAPVDRQPQSPVAGELRLRVTACAVCRTDLQLCEGDLPARRLPIVPGHQVVGVVDAVGDGVEGWAPGDRAGLTWLAGTTARAGSASRAGRTCAKPPRSRAGTATAASRAASPRGPTSRCGSRMPSRTSRRRHCCAAGVIGYRALRVAGVGPESAGCRLGLYGFGASARQALVVARAWGVEAFVATRSLGERRRALDLGAAWAGGIDDRPPVPLDAAVTFAPVGSVVAAALRALDRGGTVAINAIHLDGLPAMPYEDLWWERSIRSVANVTRRDAVEFIALAARIGLATDIETHPLAEANTALARLAAGRVSGTAVLVVDPAEDA